MEYDINTQMTTSPFDAALKEARKALAESIRDRNAIERRIVSLKQTIEGLTGLCDPDPTEELVEVGSGPDPGSQMSLTNAIRTVFSESQEYLLTPPEVRDSLVRMGVNLDKYKQPLVPIHNTLKRLEIQNELVSFRDDNGAFRGYRWVSSLARAVAEVGSHHPIHKLRMRRVNPGASNRLEQFLRLNETSIDTNELPPDEGMTRGPKK